MNLNNNSEVLDEILSGIKTLKIVYPDRWKEISIGGLQNIKQVFIEACPNPFAYQSLINEVINGDYDEKFLDLLKEHTPVGSNYEYN